MARPLYKLWVVIERLDKDGDEDHTYCPPLPDCIGVATSEKDIIQQAWAIIQNFGTHPQTSDCRPEAMNKWLRNSRPVGCNCVLCRKKCRLLKRRRRHKPQSALDKHFEKIDVPQE